MLSRAVFSRSQGYNTKISTDSSLIIIHSTQRFLSTNSAIRRGLRKSQPKTRNSKSTSQYGGNKRTAHSEGRKIFSADHRDALSKQRRPSHQQGLDVEDISGSKRGDERRTQRSNFPGRFGRLDGPSLSFKKPDRETGDYRDIRNSSQVPGHGSSWDRGSSFIPFKHKYAPASRRDLSRDLLASGASRRREDTVVEQSRTMMHHEANALIGERQETSRDQFQAPGGFESRRPSSFARTVRKSPTRAERRLALYGRGDTAPGGIPRSELDVENGDALRSASKQLRMAAKRRQLGEFSDPGLADEHDFISDVPSRSMRSEERDSSGWDREDPGRVKMDVPLAIPYTTSASEFLYGTSVIFAALTAMRRKIYKLYVYSGENREVGVLQYSIQDLARDRKVEVIKVDGDGLRMMDKVSAGRAHNVCQPAILACQFPPH